MELAFNGGTAEAVKAWLRQHLIQPWTQSCKPMKKTRLIRKKHWQTGAGYFEILAPGYGRCDSGLGCKQRRRLAGHASSKFSGTLMRRGRPIDFGLVVFIG